MVRGRQDIGQEEHVLVAEVVGNRKRVHVAVRDADVFGLAARVAAGEVRVYERQSGQVDGRTAEEAGVALAVELLHQARVVRAIAERCLTQRNQADAACAQLSFFLQ